MIVLLCGRSPDMEGLLIARFQRAVVDFGDLRERRRLFANARYELLQRGVFSLRFDINALIGIGDKAAQFERLR